MVSWFEVPRRSVEVAQGFSSDCVGLMWESPKTDIDQAQLLVGERFLFGLVWGIATTVPWGQSWRRLWMSPELVMTQARNWSVRQMFISGGHFCGCDHWCARQDFVFNFSTRGFASSGWQIARSRSWFWPPHVISWSRLIRWLLGHRIIETKKNRSPQFFQENDVARPVRKLANTLLNGWRCFGSEICGFLS